MMTIFKSILRTVRFYGTLVVVCTVFSFCESGNVRIPATVMSRDSMIQVMADIQIAEARLAGVGFRPGNQVMKSAYIQETLQKAGVDTVRFNHSFRFYASNPELFSDLYEDVIVEISKRQAEARGKQ